MTGERDLPEPLVPAEVDLRGLEYMPFFGNHLFGSEFNARCTDAEWRAGVTLWWASWNQVPAGSLPNDDAALARLADLGRDLKAWRKVKARALHGFRECTDGRLYNRFLCQQALVAWHKRVKERQKKRKWREGQNGSGDRDGGIKEPAHEPGQVGGQNVPEGGTKGVDGTADVTRRDGTGRDSTPTTNTESAYSTSPTVAIAVALRASGVGNASPNNPDVLRWAAEGVTVEQAKEAARIAVDDRGKANPSTGYIAGILDDLRNPRQGTRSSGTARAIAALEEMKENPR